MHSAKLTIAKFLSVFFLACGFYTAAFAQDNSPYSRYGLGDLAPNHNIFTRGMGGISAGVLDYQSINFVNPASLASLHNTIFDIAAEANFRTLKTSNPVKSFTSANSFFSYLQLGFPLATEKMKKKDINWGMNFGVKPLTKVNYKIASSTRITGIDSLFTLYEGNGGLSQAFIGTAIKIKKLSFGINAGYTFGSKEYSTRKVFINDTVEYTKSNTSNKTSIKGFLITGGLQYEMVLNKDNKNETPKVLRFGAYGNLQQQLNASRDDVVETFNFDANGATPLIDSIYRKKDVKGTIEYPSTLGVGFTYSDGHWLLGADYEMSNWSNYRYYGQTDEVQNNWVVRVGGQYYPAKVSTPVKNYFSFVKYRAGFFYGPDYIKINSSRPQYGFTLGTGMPLTSLQRINYTGEYVMLNTALEIGGRGDKNTGLRENMVRFSIGVSMNARWFIKRKYD